MPPKHELEVASVQYGSVLEGSAGAVFLRGHHPYQKSAVEYQSYISVRLLGTGVGGPIMILSVRGRFGSGHGLARTGCQSNATPIRFFLRQTT
jgi:hypothetical protein